MSAVLLVSILYLPLLVFLGVAGQAAMPTSSQIVSKPLEWFKIRSNARKRFDEVSLRTLGQDLRKRQISPLVCLPDGTVICGERRLRAAKLEGLPSLQVIIVTDALSEAEWKRLQLVENLQRVDLSNSEKAQGCVEFVRCNPQMALKDIAEALGVDAGMVTRWRSWDLAIEHLREALAAEKLTMNQFYDIARLPADQQAAALEAALNGKKRPRKSSGRRWRLQCETVGGTVVTLASESDGLSLDEVVETLGNLLKSAKKANEEGIDAKTWAQVLRDKAGK